MSHRKRGLTNITIKYRDIEVTLWKLYEGPLIGFICNIFEKEGFNRVEKQKYTMYITENKQFIVHDNTLMLIETDRELNIEDLIEILKNAKIRDLVPDASGLCINNSTSIYELLIASIEKYSQIHFRALEKGVQVVDVYFCSYSTYPWILHKQDLETYIFELKFYRKFVELCRDLLNFAGIKIENTCEIQNYVHLFKEEFGTFIASTLEQFDACFEASVQHHGKERAHNYVIQIPKDVVNRLGISPGSRVDVRLLLLK